MHYVHDTQIFWINYYTHLLQCFTRGRFADWLATIYVPCWSFVAPVKIAGVRTTNQEYLFVFDQKNAYGGK